MEVICEHTKQDNMDYKSLMIGDWVRMKIPYGKRWYTDKVCSLTPYCELDYQAIPLTEEILKENGFIAESGYFVWYDGVNTPSQVSVDIAFRSHNDARRIDIRNYKNSLRFAECKQYSVHELQQALRVCGLTELADNFVIPTETDG